MNSENFTPTETRKTMTRATICIIAIVLAFKFNWADFWQFLAQWR